MKKIFMLIVLLTLAVVGYKLLKPKPTVTPNEVASLSDSEQISVSFDGSEEILPSYVDIASESVASAPLTSTTETIVAASSFSCDGRQHCSQMTSCAEATYFIQHCPNTKMDGNNDGIPCEQQWCK